MEKLDITALFASNTFAKNVLDKIVNNIHLREQKDIVYKNWFLWLNQIDCTSYMLFLQSCNITISA